MLGTNGRLADPTVDDIAALFRGAELARQNGDTATADSLSVASASKVPRQQMRVIVKSGVLEFLVMRRSGYGWWLQFRL
jgi:hypothetical protein